MLNQIKPEVHLLVHIINNGRYLKFDSRRLVPSADVQA